MHGLAWCLLACFLACCAVLCYAVQGWESGVSWGDQLVDCGRWAVGLCVCVWVIDLRQVLYGTAAVLGSAREKLGTAPVERLSQW